MNLDTIKLLHETTMFLANISDACEYLSGCSPSQKDAECVKGIFGIFNYAANTAYLNMHDLTDELVAEHGFTYPLNAKENLVRDRKEQNDV